MVRKRQERISRTKHPGQESQDMRARTGRPWIGLPGQVKYERSDGTGQDSQNRIDWNRTH
jgi:hypothetical protein